jgi:hypothetical protein
MQNLYFVLVLLWTACIVALPCAAESATTGPAQPLEVQDLAFHQFYVMPVGPLGLQPTSKLLALRDKRVQLSGYMVHEEEPSPGVFMLSPQPVQLAEVADGPADDLPATTVFVHLPADQRDRVVNHRPGQWQLIGILELGAQAEGNQRVSYIRLRLDPQALRPALSPVPAIHNAIHGQPPFLPFSNGRANPSP